MPFISENKLKLLRHVPQSVLTEDIAEELISESTVNLYLRLPRIKFIILEESVKESNIGLMKTVCKN